MVKMDKLKEKAGPILYISVVAAAIGFFYWFAVLYH